MAAMIKDRYDINNKYYLPQLVINYINLPKSHPHFIEEKPLKLRLPIYRDNIKQESIFKEYHSSCNIVNQPYGKFKYYQQIRKCSISSCNNNTDILPYCTLHTKEILKLEVKESSIPNAGNGLFAVNNNSNEIIFNIGDIIYKMEGEILNQKTFLNRYGCEYAHHNTYFTPYAAQLPTSHVIDATIVRGVCALVFSFKYTQNYLG